ncbi:MAG: carbamoyltransferase HypF [Clostridiales bacterium]|nr:carbamoyltransferase HypF [Clostridiales bacterium]
MAVKITERIRLWGIVQGVGFRPYVAKVAESLGMKGTVSNIGGLVEIYVTDTPQRISAFLGTLIEQKPGPAEIVHVRRDPAPLCVYETFSILKSGEGEREVAMIPADIAVCPDCLREMYEPADRRYRHPFISCMVCGPRYTIVDRFPYDRDNTSMIDFPMCPSCEAEYTTLTDRRYHAQTISCHDCGPQMLERLQIDDPTDKLPLERAAALLKEGCVVGFKSMGGYNLLADPLDPEAVRMLREMKGREKKPFAVMFRSVDEIRQYCSVSEVEEKLLTSSARPILLLERKPADELQAFHPADYSEFEKSRFIGAFLPSMGAQYLLLDDFGGPLIATSANLSGMPIIKEDEEMFRFQDTHPDLTAVFYNKRKIRVSVDDSVCRVIDGQPQIIRRSKGYAPVPLYAEPCEQELLACGGQLKNSFALGKGGFVYPSQYFGDMDSAENRALYEENVERMAALFRVRPEKVVCDLHPDYYTTRYAEVYAKTHGLPLVRIQHHHAHVASVMAENAISGPVIGVSFDGTGYGTDGAIWGGEFLLCEKGSMERLAHLKYVDMIGGDSSMDEGWKSAASYLYAVKNGYYDEAAGGQRDSSSEDITIDIRDLIAYSERMDTLAHRETEILEKAIAAGINTVKSSSMGRLFDAAAALLGICDYNSYEGECAILLEDAAARAKKTPERSEADDLALVFHMRIAYMIAAKCRELRERTGVSKVALTGGVFQNRILMEETLEQLRAVGFETYYNISVSPNDGGIALGQAYAASFLPGEPSMA